MRPTIPNQERYNMSETLMDTKLDEMTVGDAVKANVIVLAATAAVMVTLVGAAVAYDKFEARRQNRKFEKTQKEDEE